jgi:hypothetical protein
MLAVAFNVPLWLVACLVIVAVAAVCFSRIRATPHSGMWDIDVETPFKVVVIGGGAVFAIMLVLVIQGFIGW